MDSSEIRVGLLAGARVIKLKSAEGLLVQSRDRSIRCRKLEIHSDGVFPVKRLYRVFTDDFERLEDALDAALKSDESPIRGAVEVGREIEPYSRSGYHNTGFWAFAGEFEGEEEALSFARHLEEKGKGPGSTASSGGILPVKSRSPPKRANSSSSFPSRSFPQAMEQRFSMSPWEKVSTGSTGKISHTGGALRSSGLPAAAFI